MYRSRTYSIQHPHMHANYPASTMSSIATQDAVTRETHVDQV
jgi:hypothetical protein